MPHLVSILICLAACGDTMTVKPPAKPHIELAPPPGMTVRYGACWATGSGVLELGTAHDPLRDLTAETVKLGTRTWRITPFAAQDLTIEGRLRIETPQLIAVRDDARVRLATTGASRDELVAILARLDDPTVDAERGTHHQIGSTHLHFAWPAAFESAAYVGTDEGYRASFTAYSVWGGMAGSPARVVDGASLRWSAYQQPSDDHGALPMLTSRHGEAMIGPLVLGVDGTGTRVDDASFLAFGDAILRAAMADVSAPCRERPGRWGDGYVQSPTDPVQMIPSELVVTLNGLRATLTVSDDGTIRADGARIGNFSVNGYVFAWRDGLNRLLGVIDGKGTFHDEVRDTDLIVDARGTITDATGQARVTFHDDGRVDGAITGRYAGPADGRRAAAVALLVLSNGAP